MKTKLLIPKKKNHAFGKDIYLLGEDSNNILYWLEAPSWDCGWYWGFGYVTTYTNNEEPHLSKDINSHGHIETLLDEKGVYNLIDSPRFNATTFNEEESWKLTELFEQFYFLKKMAGLSHRDLPGCNVTTSPVNHGSLKKWNEKINKTMIPAVTAKIIEILTPSNI